MNEEEFLKEHPGLKGQTILYRYYPSFRNIIHKTQLDKQKVEGVIDKERESHYIPKWIRDMLKKELGL